MLERGNSMNTVQTVFYLNGLMTQQERDAKKPRIEMKVKD